MTFRHIGLCLAALLAIGFSAAGVASAHGPHDYGHQNPFGYYHGYPSYGGEYWLRHQHHYVYRPHNWHWHPDVNGYVYNGWGGNHGGPGHMSVNGMGGGPLFYEGAAAATPTTTRPSTPPATNPFTDDDLPEIPELE